MKKTLITTTLFLACSGVFAQALSEKDLQEIQSSFKKDASTKAIQNILTADKDIKGNALNRDLQGKIDHYFKYRADVKGITNQLSSGRCWMFTSMNVLRPSIMKKYNLSQFDFSHNYLYFWDIFEKSNLFLENIIATAKQPMDDRTVVEYFKAPVGDGGVWKLYYNAAARRTRWVTSVPCGPSRCRRGWQSVSQNGFPAGRLQPCRFYHDSQRATHGLCAVSVRLCRRTG